MSTLPKSTRLWAPVLGGGLLLLYAMGGTPRTSRRPVILVMLDTLRADHMGFYGYERDTSPHLDAFARESLAFKHAFTAAPWTPPSVVTMLTGLYASSHGHTPPNSRKEAKRSSTRLSSELLTLPKVLKQQGYKTAAVSPNPWIAPLFGFDQGFDDFVYLHKEPAAKIVSAALELLEKLGGRSEPFFLYLHFFDPHDPYEPPEPYREMFPPRLSKSEYAYGPGMLRQIRLYDGEIRYLDDELGRLFAFLKERGLYDRALILVVADHGEQFREHGSIHHGNALHNEEVHVPFFVRDPRSDRLGEVEERVVSTIDIFPTILGQLGIPLPAPPGPGLSVFASEALAQRAGVLSEVRRVTDQRAFISREGRKAIFEIPLLSGEPEGEREGLWKEPRLVGLFDLERDYFEQRPLEEPKVLARLHTRLFDGFRMASTRRVRGESIPQVEVSEEVLDQLKSLGYLQ